MTIQDNLRRNLVFFRRASLSLTALCLPLSIAASNIACGLALLALMAEAAVPFCRRPYRRTGLEFPWLGLMAASAAGILFSADPVHALKRSGDEILILFFLAASQGQDEEDANRNMDLFLISCAAAAVWSLFQASLGILRGPGGALDHVPGWAHFLPDVVLRELATPAGRGLGFYSHPLTFAGVMTLGFFLALGRWTEGRPPRSTLSGAAAVLLWLGLLASGGRTALAASAAFGVGYLFWKRSRWAWGVLMVSLAAGGLWMSSPEKRERMSLSHPSALLRLELWRTSWEEFKKNPLTGQGPGHFRVSTKELSGEVDYPDMVWSESHNIALQALVEKGLLGFAALSWFMVALGRIFVRGASQSGRGGLFWGFLALLMAGATESWTQDSEVMMALYFLAGTVSAGLHKNLRFLQREQSG